MAGSSKKPIQDVAKPGATPADATSRPVIVNRNSMIKDPMVTEADTTTEDKPEEKLATVSTSDPKKVIKPLAETDEKDKPTDKPETTTRDTPEPETKDKREEAASEQEPISDNAVVDAVLDQVNEGKQQAVEDKEAEARETLVNKLVEEKKYFVPLATAQHRRNNKIAMIAICALVPLFVGIVLAIDAGVIDAGIQLPFDLIK